MNKLLGKIIKQCRESKNMTLSQAAGNTLSISMLSKFENGLSDISTTYFLGILENLNLSLADVSGELSLAGYSLLSNRQRQFQRLLNSSDGPTLRNFYLKYRFSPKLVEKQSALIAHLYVQRSTNQEPDFAEIDQLVDYLAAIENWHNYEFDLFLVSMPFLSENTLLFLMPETPSQLADDNQRLHYQRLSLQLIGYYLQHAQPAKALTHITRLKNEPTTTSTADFQLRLRFYERLSRLRLNDNVGGNHLLTRAITIAKTLNFTTTSQFFADTLAHA